MAVDRRLGRAEFLRDLQERHGLAAEGEELDDAQSERQGAGPRGLAPGRFGDGIMEDELIHGV